MIYLHLRASNDKSGNPRWLFLVLGNDGRPDAVVNEGYRGYRDVIDLFPMVKEGPRINITVVEYNEWVEWAEERNVIMGDV